MLVGAGSFSVALASSNQCCQLQQPLPSRLGPQKPDARGRSAKLEQFRYPQNRRCVVLPRACCGLLKTSRSQFAPGGHCVTVGLDIAVLDVAFFVGRSTAAGH